MAYLQLKSTNPNLSYILRKNPESGMLIKPNRKGTLFAWYTNPEIFNIYFRDSDTEVSYGKEEFEYMDATRYNAPMFSVNAFSEFLNHIRKLDDHDISGYDNTLVINMIKCKQRNLNAFKANFTDYSFDYVEMSSHNYRITIKTKNTVCELVNLGQMFAIFSSLLNDDLEAVADQDIDKYMNCVRVIDAPYYIRHLFKIYFIKTNRLFEKYKSLLETTNRAKIEFEFGSTLKQRINFIKKYIDPKAHIIDIGCGEGSYVREFARHLDENVEYHAIDTNPDCIEQVKRLCEKKKIENVAVWSSLDDFINGNSSHDNSIVLLTEVIEHMSKEEASLFISKALQLPYETLIITTPNKDFNENYKLFDENMRNEDHKFEMTKDEFRNFIIGIVNKDEFSDFMLEIIEDKVTNKNKNVHFFEIGDKVNNLQPTLAVVIK